MQCVAHSLGASYGAGTFGGGLANLAASLPFPPQGQLIADYIVESSAGEGISTSGGDFSGANQQGGDFQSGTQT